MAEEKINGQKEYTVIRMVCENCGEDVYYVFACTHCGEYLSYDKSEKMTKDQIKSLMEEEGKEFRGDIKAIIGTRDELDRVDNSLGSLEVDEVDELYSGPFSDL